MVGNLFTKARQSDETVEAKKITPHYWPGPTMHCPIDLGSDVGGDTDSFMSEHRRPLFFGRLVRFRAPFMIRLPMICFAFSLHIA